MMPHMRCDKGATRHILSGSDVMCPGLTSAGAQMDDVPALFPVAVMAEGKEHAMAIGVTKMSTKEINEINKGIGIEVIHFLNDSMWHLRP